MFERKTYRYMRGVAVRRRRQDCASLGRAAVRRVGAAANCRYRIAIS